MRLFFVVFAVGSLYGIYDNREFLTKFPFYLLALADAAFAVAFFYFFFTFNKLGKVRSKISVLSVLAYGTYVVVVNLAGFWFYASNLGVANIATEVGLSSSAYMAQQILYLGIAPAAAFIAMALLVRRIR